MTVRVIKVGGSLLDWPELAPRLWQWLQSQPAGKNFFLAGGGALADAIRAADTTHRLGEETSHRLCIELLGTTGRLLEHLLTSAKSAPGAAVDGQRHTSVLDVPALLTDEATAARVRAALPHSWEVTSDSIAAYLAEALGAHELILLKSAALSGSMSFAEAASAGYVDRYFPTAAARVSKVRAVHLRATGCNDWLLYR